MGRDYHFVECKVLNGHFIGKFGYNVFINRSDL